MQAKREYNGTRNYYSLLRLYAFDNGGDCRRLLLRLLPPSLVEVIGFLTRQSVLSLLLLRALD